MARPETEVSVGLILFRERSVAKAFFSRFFKFNGCMYDVILARHGLYFLLQLMEVCSGSDRVEGHYVRLSVQTPEVHVVD